MTKISIVSPCFNEQGNVVACYEAIQGIFETELKGYEREHVFVDNASTDATLNILKQLAARDSAVKIVANARNFGLFRSTFNALRYATGDATLVMLPVDLQDPPELLPEFVRLWEGGYEVVAGVRREREEGLLMRILRRMFYSTVNRMSGFEIPENVGDFQLLDRKVLDAVLQFDDHYPYIRGIIAACGFKRTLVHYTWRKRKHGKSKIPSWELVDQALNGILSFTNIPMRLCLFVGLFMSLMCFLYALYSLIVIFVAPNTQPPGIASLIVGMFFLFSLQLIFMGIIGEYVASIHAQVRHGPRVVERERINIKES